MVDINNMFSLNEQFEDLDKKITIKYLKEKRTSRTYIEGIENFVSEKDIGTFCGKLKKQLGTGVITRDFNENKLYGFNGDHRQRIKDILINTAGIDESKIDIKA